MMAAPEAVAAYQRMAASEAFQHPIAYDAIRPEDYDALLLSGGHDKGMRPYLENAALQRAVAAVAWFFDHDKPVAAICHGTLLAARSVSQDDPARRGKSVLFGRKTTGLTRNQEMVAYHLTRYKLGDYYRTYDVTMNDELKSFLRDPSDYSAGPGWPIPMGRDTADDLDPGFIVRDGKYLSARWPGDAHRFAAAFVVMLSEQ
jgi:protease I